MPKFGRYEHPLTIEAAYLEGYKTGIKWTHPWTPGGPMVANGLPSDASRHAEWHLYVCIHAK